MQLFWHRADLRGPDNRGLTRAAADGAVLPVFVLDEDVLEHAGSPRAAFLCRALAALRDWYQDRGGDLLVRRGDPAAVLPDVAAEHGADGVVWNRDYSGLARERDARVRDALEARGVSVTAVHDRLLHEPGSITTNDGETYSVYSYFWETWRDREKDAPVSAPAADAFVGIDGGLVPSPADLGFDAPDADLPTAGTEAARERLAEFCDGPIYDYDERRDYPADGCTSRLSQDLSFGTIGVREVYAATALADAPDADARAGVETYREQLAWREFYTHVLAANPETVTENGRTYERPIEWRNDEAELRAWKRGETGYPFVDAGMRQLRTEAFVHNRVRMVVASFLTKDLLVDWRLGYDHFHEHLVDHDTASDVGGWQWVASTGVDAQPYFRIFNPMTQGERYDPDAAYITDHVPELDGVDPSTIHAWHELDDAERAAIAPDYQSPIVEHAERRAAALDAFERARGGS